MMKLSYMWDGHPTTFVVLSLYCLFHSLCNPEKALIILNLSRQREPSSFDGSMAVIRHHAGALSCCKADRSSAMAT